MVEFVEEETSPPVTPQPPAGPATTPWHLWAVGGLSLLWNLFGAVDYTMSQTRNEAYLKASAESMGITAGQMIDWIDSFPAWQHAFWALGVWGALAGSILLLMRSRYAVWAFGVSLLGLAVTQVYQALVPKPDWADAAFGMTLVIWAIALSLLVYSAGMARRGRLR